MTKDFTCFRLAIDFTVAKKIIFSCEWSRGRFVFVFYIGNDISTFPTSWLFFVRKRFAYAVYDLGENFLKLL